MSLLSNGCSPALTSFGNPLRLHASLCDVCVPYELEFVSYQTLNLTSQGSTDSDRSVLQFPMWKQDASDACVHVISCL